MLEAARTFARTRLFRFLTVGGGAALLFLVLAYCLVSFGLSPFIGSVVAYAAAFAVAYWGQRSWTFGGQHNHVQALPRYVALQIGCAGFAGLVSHFAATRLGMSPLPMAATATIAASAASYVLSSIWVFPARN